VGERETLPCSSLLESFGEQIDGIEYGVPCRHECQQKSEYPDSWWDEAVSVNTYNRLHEPRTFVEGSRLGVEPIQKTDGFTQRKRIKFN